MRNRLLLLLGICAVVLQLGNTFYYRENKTPAVISEKVAERSLIEERDANWQRREAIGSSIKKFASVNREVITSKEISPKSEYVAVNLSSCSRICSNYYNS